MRGTGVSFVNFVGQGSIIMLDSMCSFVVYGFRPLHSSRLKTHNVVHSTSVFASPSHRRQSCLGPSSKLAWVKRWESSPDLAAVMARSIRNRGEQSVRRILDKGRLKVARGVQHGAVILLAGDYCQRNAPAE